MSGQTMLVLGVLVAGVVAFKWALSRARAELAAPSAYRYVVTDNRGTELARGRVPVISEAIAIALELAGEDPLTIDAEIGDKRP